eukprot:CAMPEP_0198135340 /NCGR_PEP_ID=MMETSP1442-20131203/60539_1 /TAXON_ID= /ORGANISM="Craspedostauros australis, Strain CCMP3328" /LENGTH=149 /DNA_ID=CAMNT_0043796505 /DNA_START=188 /DNA_END=637 /DNA_ORIENTATION=-
MILSSTTVYAGRLEGLLQTDVNPAYVRSHQSPPRRYSTRTAFVTARKNGDGNGSHDGNSNFAALENTATPTRLVQRHNEGTRSSSLSSSSSYIREAAVLSLSKIHSRPLVGLTYPLQSLIILVLVALEFTKLFRRNPIVIIIIFFIIHP